MTDTAKTAIFGPLRIGALELRNNLVAAPMAGGVTDAVALAKARAGLDADDRVRIVELPRLSPGLLGLVGRFLGVEAAPSSGIWELPAVRAALDAVPPALLVAPGAQARLPFDLIWE